MIILLSIWSLMDEKQKTRLLVTCKSTISANASNDLKVTKKSIKIPRDYKSEWMSYI